MTGATALTFLYTRSAHVGYFIVGALTFNTAAKGLKKVIRQERPVVAVAGAPKVKQTYGMPSTHSTSIAFFMTYILLTSEPLSFRSLATLVWGGAIMWSRVHLGYHTKEQVLVGAMIGLFGGLVWRWAWLNLATRRGFASELGLWSKLESPQQGVQRIVDATYAKLGL